MTDLEPRASEPRGSEHPRASEHFTLEKLADGVYATLATPERGAASNSGIVALGDGVLVFDTTLTAVAGDDLCAAAVQLDAGPVRYVINSHRHPDHVMGNSAFPADAQIISTSLTRELMLKHISEFIRAYRQNRAQAELDLRAAEERLLATDDPGERAMLSETIRTSNLLLEAAARARLRAPNWTFEQHIELYGGTRVAEIISFGAAHTESDAILWLPDEGIAFVADLLFKGRHPWAGDGDLTAWQSSIDHVLALEPRLVVPGHGPLATAADLEAQRTYLGVLEQAVARALVDGLPEDDAAIEVPAEYHDLARPEGYARSLKALVERARKERK